jgi:hypothetical protein
MAGDGGICIELNHGCRREEGASNRHHFFFLPAGDIVDLGDIAISHFLRFFL